MSRARVFIASSLDGFIAGPDDEIDWLSDFDGIEDTFTPFLAEIGALLMGRRTFEVVDDMGGPTWGYGDTPVLVATNRPLATTRATVRGISGTVSELLEQAKAEADGRDVYVDGGALIRSVLDAGLVDEVTVTLIPIALGDGIPLFAGVERRHHFELLGSRPIGRGLVQLTYAPRR